MRVWECCKRTTDRWNGVVAQLVERLVRNEKVAGSIPVGSTIRFPSENGINPRESGASCALPLRRVGDLSGSCPEVSGSFRFKKWRQLATNLEHLIFLGSRQFVAKPK